VAYIDKPQRHLLLYNTLTVDQFIIKAQDLQNFTQLVETPKLEQISQLDRWYIDLPVQPSTRKPILKVIMKGAGEGKTYTIVNMLSNKSELYELTKNKKFIIYLTKLNTATEPILLELSKQYNDKQFETEFTNEKGEKLDPSDTEKMKSGRQFKIKTDNGQQIIIGTVDSFIYNLCPPKVREALISSNYFSDLALELSKEKDPNTKFLDVPLSEKTTIVIDEIQDLSTDYLDAINNVQQTTNFDIVFCGDLLQSIISPINCLTKLRDRAEKRYQNTIRRFKNEQLVGFVNSFVDFKKYDCLPITDFGAKPDKSDLLSSDVQLKPVMFPIPNRPRNSDTNNTFINDTSEICLDEHTPIYGHYKNTIAIILDIFRRHVGGIGYIEYMENGQKKRRGYAPQDFMIISPTVKNNLLLEVLQMELQNFWLDIYKEQKPYVILHRHDGGEGGGPIDLTESRESTQIMSIHSSKGSGRPIVIGLGLSDSSLSSFDKDQGLVYESLKHVLVTRPMHYLYIGYDGNSGMIFEKLHHAHQNGYLDKIENSDCNKNTQNISDHTKSDNLLGYLLSVENDFPVEKYIQPFPMKNNEHTFEMIHHIVINKIFRWQMVSHIVDINRHAKMGGQQLDAMLLGNLKIAKIDMLNYKQFNREIDQHTCCKGNKKYGCPCFKTIYLPKYENAYTNNDIFQKIFENVQQKIKNQDQNFCSLESIVILFSLEQIYRKIYSDFSVLELYQIIDYYKDNFYDFQSENTAHDLIKHDSCKCSKMFETKYNVNEKGNRIIRFYERVSEFITSKKEEIEVMFREDDQIKGYHKVSVNPWIKGDFCDQFKLHFNLPAIAHNSDRVIPIYIQQNFNQLNCVETVIRVALNSLILNITDIEQYIGKRVNSTIFSLDTGISMLTFEKDDLKILKKLVHEYLYRQYQMKHLGLSTYIAEIYDKSEGKKKFSKIRKEIEKANNPTYIKDVFGEIETDENRKLRILVKSNKGVKSIDKNNLLSALDRRLNEVIYPDDTESDEDSDSSSD
jgi:hypothetical protein